MLFREIIRVYSKNHTNPLNTYFKQKNKVNSSQICILFI
jgi:hypothetical protein